MKSCCRERLGIVAKRTISYTKTMPEVIHPYIVSDQEVCGGRPRINGTRITVRTVVTAVLRQGQSPAEVLEHYPHLTLANIHDALSYYYDHQNEIDLEIAEHEAMDPVR